MQIVTAAQLSERGIEQPKYLKSPHTLLWGTVKEVREAVIGLYEYLVASYDLKHAREFPLFGIHKPYEVALAESATGPILNRDRSLIGMRLWHIPEDRLKEALPYLQGMMNTPNSRLQ